MAIVQIRRNAEVIDVIKDNYIYGGVDQEGFFRARVHDSTRKINEKQKVGDTFRYRGETYRIQKDKEGFFIQVIKVDKTKDYFAELKQGKIWFENIPTECLTEKMCLHEISKSCCPASTMRLIPKKLQTKKLVDALIQGEKYSALMEIDSKYHTKDLILKMIKKCPEAIKLSPDKTDNFILKALEINHRIIEELEEPSEAVRIKAFEKDKRYFKDLPDHMKTREVCLEALKESPWVYADLSEEYQLDDEFMKYMHRHVYLSACRPRFPLMMM